MMNRDELDRQCQLLGLKPLSTVAIAYDDGRQAYGVLRPALLDETKIGGHITLNGIGYHYGAQSVPLKRINAWTPSTPDEQGLVGKILDDLTTGNYRYIQ